MKKLIIKIAIIISTIIIFTTVINPVKASASESVFQEQLEYYAKNIDINNITKEDILKLYDEITQQYTNEELADMIEENSQEIEKQGVSRDVIEAGTNLIRTTDKDEIRDIIENDIDVEEIKEKINQGYTPNQIIRNVVEETPNEKIIEIIIKIILANKIVRVIIIVMVLLFIYGTILRWILYTKAGKHGWAAIIPVYRQIVMYKICGLSPWLMLLWLIPVFGWLAMFIIAIMKRFYFARSFGKGALFGLGLLLLPPIFQSILAFNPNIEYEEIE